MPRQSNPAEQFIREYLFPVARHAGNRHFQLGIIPSVENETPGVKARVWRGNENSTARFFNAVAALLPERTVTLDQANSTISIDGTAEEIAQDIHLLHGKEAKTYDALIANGETRASRVGVLFRHAFPNAGRKIDYFKMKL